VLAGENWLQPWRGGKKGGPAGVGNGGKGEKKNAGGGGRALGAAKKIGFHPFRTKPGPGGFFGP